MGKNANFVSHKKSKLKNQDGSPQLPSASALVMLSLFLLTITIARKNLVAHLLVAIAQQR